MRIFWRTTVLIGILAGTNAAALAVAPQDIATSANGDSYAVASPPENPPAPTIEDVDKALQGDRLTEAGLLLDKLEEIGNSDVAPQVALLRSEYLLASGRAGEARARLTDISVPAALTCRLLLARALASLESSSEASGEDWSGAAENSCAASPLYWSLRARTELARGAFHLAVTSYEEALALAPDDDELAGDLAVALLAAGDARSAELRLDQLLKRHAQDKVVLLNLDFARAMLGRLPIRNDTEDLETWSRRLEAAAKGAQRSGRKTLAEALYSQALIARPKHDPRLWDEYAKVSEAP